MKDSEIELMRLIVKQFLKAQNQKLKRIEKKLLKSIEENSKISYNRINETHEEDNKMMDMDKLTVKQLQAMAKEIKVKNWWTMNKPALIEALTKKDDKKETPKGEKVEKPIVKQPEIKEDEVKPTENNEGTEKDDKRTSTKGMNKEGITTLQDILDDIKKETKTEIKGMKARRILRNSDVERPFKKWEWDTNKHKKIIEQVKKLLN